jgi:hypothetical protein
MTDAYTGLEHTQTFRKLRTMFVVFICDFDPFGYKDYLYIAKCDLIGKKNSAYDDRIVRLYYNTKGRNGVLSSEMMHILQYMNNPARYQFTGDTPMLVKKMDEAVKFSREDKKGRLGFKVYMSELIDAKDQGIEIGKEEGIQIGEGKGRLGAAIDAVKDGVINPSTIAKIGLFSVERARELISQYGQKNTPG